ncbi:BPTD_3080 family restriction endonuclease [Methanocella arvoryzae]|nr:DEAD/DEAH box helicase family protein [Methanocella arvoryzae]
MGKFVIDKLIINSPYEEPKEYWSYNPGVKLFERIKGRRPAGYLIASERSRTYDDPGEFRSIKLVNDIRPRIKQWREAGYPGATGVTRRLLEHWHNIEERDRRFFFCQLEAIETLIWLTEAPDADKVGIIDQIQGDGGPFRRLCSKMATGSGKTIVMAMLIAWQVLNKVTYPQDSRYSKNIFVVAPGLTVKSRLGVLIPSSEGNYYDEFNIVPIADREKLRQGKVMIRNWQALAWESAERLQKKKSVDKRGPKSDEAYVREVLEDMAGASNIVVINDEAHHAWRIVPGEKLAGLSKEEKEEATVWISGLDRIHKARNILTCYDFSATPFVPSGKKSTEEALFGWIVSDFGLNDAIESGLVKTPRIVVRDDALPDAKSYMSKLYHVYEHVKEDLARKAEETEPLPDLVINAYDLLGADWLETKKSWEERGYPVPPVMISVVNITNTAARVEYAFTHKKVHVDELCDPKKLLHIDSKVLDMAESEVSTTIEPVAADGSDSEDGEQKLSKKELAELLRRKVDTVGQVGKPGEQIQNVISVGMLSEGWDAKTVTHIMGLRAFTSQLLCEQVVGRGLRRTSYDINPETGLFDAEYVNIFGVPFTFLPHEASEGTGPVPPQPKWRVEPLPQKSQYEIRWPNILRVDYTYKTVMSLDMDKVKPLVIDAKDTVISAELAAVIEGKPNFESLTEIDLEKLGKMYRMQRIIFESARDIFEMMRGKWKGDERFLMAQLVRIVQDFLKSDKLKISQTLYAQDDLRRRILIMLNMTKVVQHVANEIKLSNSEAIVPVFDPERPSRTTGDMQAWYTSKPNHLTQKSHINLVVYDSAWEATEAYRLDHSSDVEAWVKNDHLGFEIVYMFNGVVRKYRPDFIVRLKGGKHLVLEVKGQETFQDQVKRAALEEWIKAVNQHGGFGVWSSAVSRDPADVEEIIRKECQ